MNSIKNTCHEKSNFKNFEIMIKKYIEKYVDQGKVEHIEFLSNLKKTSEFKDENGKSISLYKGDTKEKDLDVFDMDIFAQKVYKLIKKPNNPKEESINTVDSFLINNENQWYLIEFKNSSINGSKRSKGNPVKNNIIRKAYSNMYMLLDILYEMKDVSDAYENFNFNNPIKFIQENVTYILVCSYDKNSDIHEQIKNYQLRNEEYTPGFMSRLKGYIFKDAYIYTEDYFERKFVNVFKH